MTSCGFDFNNVKAEKTAAMRRYNRQKKLKSLLFAVEVLAALALLLWYSTYYVPVVSDVAADFLRRSVFVFRSHLYVFFIINVLVVVIFASSLQKPSKPKFYDEYVSITTTKTTVSARRASSDSAPNHSPTHDESVTSGVSDRQIVCVDNAAHNRPAEQSIVRATKTQPPSPPYCGHELSLAVSSVRQSRVGLTTETRKYRRTRSERYGKENRPELRRSETVIKRETTAVRVEEPRRSSSAMDDLSSEEFRSTIETFIADKKKSLIRENTLDLILERKECVAITLTRFN